MAKRDPIVWREWGRNAPMHSLNEFLSRFDVGETQIQLEDDLEVKGKRLGRFIVEIQKLEEE